MIGNEDQITFSPNGEYLAFISDDRGDTDIYVKAIEGRFSIKIGASETKESRPAWSPDSKKIAYMVEGDSSQSIWIKSLENDELQVIATPSILPSRPAWSPDGEWIVFNGNDGQSSNVYMIQVSTSELVQLTGQQGMEYHFGFSPDGKYVGYNVRGAEFEDLFAISIETKESINLTNHSGHEWHPHWSPNSDKVLFYSTWGEEMTEVHTVDFPSGSITNISGHIVEDFGGVFSPDGSKVVFISKRDGKNDLYTYSFETHETESLGIGHKLKRGWPTWSPGGEKIAFSTNQEEVYLYEINILTGKSQKVTKNVNAEEFPAVSKDGRHLAFVTEDEGSESNIMLYDLSVDEILPFTITHHLQTRPQFSNRNNSIGFVQSSGGGPTTRNAFVMSLDKQDSIQITETGGIRHFIWTKDDQGIIYAYDSAVNFSYDLWRKDFSSDKPYPLLKTPGSEVPTSLSKDGSHFLFHGNTSGVDRIYRMSVFGGDPELIEHELTSGTQPSYSSDDSRIVFVSNNNIERTYDIYTMDGNGENVKRLTNDRYKETSPKWSSNGESIFYSVQKGSRDIWFYNMQSIRH